MHKVIAILLPLLFLLAGVVEAEIYKWIDPAGNTHFSDKPVRGSKQQHIGNLNSISNPAFNLEKSSMQMEYTERNGNMFVPGRVNGIEMQFMVDTGATYVAIPPAIARRAQINTAGSQKVLLQTANGKITVPLVSVPRIEADGVKQENILTTVQEFSQDGVTGLLGMSFLSAYRMSIDHDKKLILLEKQ